MNYKITAIVLATMACLAQPVVAAQGGACTENQPRSLLFHDHRACGATHGFHRHGAEEIRHQAASARGAS